MAEKGTLTLTLSPRERGSNGAASERYKDERPPGMTVFRASRPCLVYPGARPEKTLGEAPDKEKGRPVLGSP